MADDKDPFAKYLAPPAAPTPEAADPFAKYLSAPVVQPGEQMTDPATGVQLPGPPSQPTTTEDVAALKKGMYGNDAEGAGLAANTHFLGDIPLVGPPLLGATDRLYAAGKSLVSGTKYADELKAAQDQEKAATEQHLIASTVGGAAGTTTAALPAAAAAPALFGLDRAATLTRNVLNAGRTGAVLSGATAAENDVVDPNKTWGETAKDVGYNTGVGAATYGAAPLIGAGIGSLVTKLAAKSTAAGSPLADEDQRALGWVIGNLKRDNLLTDTEIEKRYADLGPKAFLGEYGENSLGLTNALASAQGAAKTQIYGGLKARASEAPQDIEDGISTVLGPRQNLAEVTRSDIAARGEAASPLYKQFKETTVFPTQPVRDLIAGTVDKATGTPIAGLEQQGLLNDAYDLAVKESAATGQPVAPMKNFFITGEQKSWPTTQSFDYIKQAIDGRIAGSYKMQPFSPMPQPTAETRFYLGMKRRLDDAIAQANPEASAVWKQARKAWGNPTEIMNARAEGQNILNRGTRRDELQIRLDNADPPVRKALLEGMRDDLAETMDESIRGAANTQNKLLSPAAQDKLRMVSKAVTGDEMPAQDLIDRLEQMRGENFNKNFITAQSKTNAAQQAQKEITPDPSQTLIARGRSMYSPHVTPAAYIPFGKMMEEAAAKGQAQQYENSMNAAAPWLMKQGPEAMNFAKALAAYDAQQRGAAQAGPNANQMIQLLARGIAPKIVPPLAGAAQSVLQPNQQ